MQIIITDATVLNGEHVSPSLEPIEIDEPTGLLLISASKAGKYVSPAGPTIEEAKTELLGKIAGAETVEELELLLSEDPDIVAAYETRMQELSDVKKEILTH